MEDDIILLEPGQVPAPAPIDLSVNDVVLETGTIPAPRRRARITLGVPAPVVVPVVINEPVLYHGSAVTAFGKCLKAGNSTLAYVSGHYTMGYGKEAKPAVSTMMGHTPVFCSSAEDMEIFKTLLDIVDITVAEGKTLCFFTGEGYCANAADVEVVCLDGSVIRYGHGSVLSPENPILQPADKIFREIQTFTKRSVFGIQHELDTEKRINATTQARRAEDIYLYLADTAPLEGRQDIHDILLRRAEETYNTDLALNNRELETIARLKAKVDAAKSQLPSGRKGVPIRNAYLTSPVLKQLLDSFLVARNGDRLDVTFGFRKDLIVEGIHYGRPTVTVKMLCRSANGRDGRDGTFIRDTGGVVVLSEDKQAFMHPHIEGTSRWCLGTFIKPINNAILGGNIPVAASLLWQYLSTYNQDSPLIRLADCRTQMAAARPRDLIVRRK
jgi:hypothetical protein